MSGEDPHRLNEAVAALQSGRHRDAVTLCETHLIAHDDDAEAWHLLGVAKIAANDRSGAISALRQSLAYSIDQPQCRLNLGVVYAQLGRQSEAANEFDLVTRDHPDLAQGWRYLAQARLSLRELERAAVAAETLIQLAPQDASAHRLRAEILLAQGRFDEALAIYRHGHRQQPQEASWRQSLTTALKRQSEAAAERGDRAWARAAIAEALQLAPGDADALTQAADLAQAAGDVADAEAGYRAALAADPQHGEAAARFFVYLMSQCRWAEAATLRPQIDAANRLAIALGRHAPETPFVDLAIRDDPAGNLELARSWAAAAQRRAAAPTMPPIRPVPRAKLRIGYLSADFRDHAVGHLIVGPLAHHDRDGFAIHGYALGPRDDSPWSKRIDAAVDSVTDLAGLTPLAAAERIRADGIDILVDLMGYTSGGRPEIAALRPAPLQALWLGFPGTAGGAAYDYLIADRIVAPPEFQPHCAERIAWLPHCYLPTDPQQAIAETPEDRQAAGLPAEGTIFVSLNQPFKLEPTLWSVWMEILRAVPGSHLWLRPKGERAAAHLRAAAEAAGIDPTRLIALERLPDKTQHLRRLSFADLALDTRLYNGHVTTLDALWAGLPTLALAGRHMASRGSMSALTALDMEELIAGDLAAYRDLAIALGRDGVRRQALRTKLATRLRQRPLFDAQAFARDLEALYRRLWRQALAGKRADGPISAEAEDRKAS